MKLIFFSICVVFSLAADFSSFLPQIPNTNSLPSIPSFPPTQNPVKFINPSTSSNLVTNTIPNRLQNTIPSFNFPNVFPSLQSNPISTFLQQLLSTFTNNPFQGLRQLNPSSFGSAPQSIVQSLESAFENFQKIVNGTLSRGVENVEKSINQLNSTAQSTIANINDLAAQAVDRFEQEVQKYNETIRTCISEHAPAYREIIPAAINQSIACVNYKVQNGVQIIEEGRNDISAAVEGASDLSSSLQECSSGYHFGCYISALVNIRSETIFLPLRLTRRFAEISAYVASVSADIAKCTVIVGEAVAAQSINVTQTITNCLLGRN
jgi:DNA-binding XRE family transcriptional regulator